MEDEEEEGQIVIVRLFPRTNFRFRGWDFGYSFKVISFREVTWLFGVDGSGWGLVLDGILLLSSRCADLWTLLVYLTWFQDPYLSQQAICARFIRFLSAFVLLSSLSGVEIRFRVRTFPTDTPQFRATCLSYRHRNFRKKEMERHNKV